MVLAAAALGGCIGITEITGPEKEDDIWTGPGANISESEGSVCHVTGFDYPDGYDWRTDDGNKSVRCSLVVFADGVPMLKLAVGEKHEVSSDPDMHWMIGGHLYTEYCAEGKTILRKDGKALLKYDGEESIRGFIVDDEDIYTLGVPRDGKGFTYRKNGETVMERMTGYAFERLHNDEDRICFAFCQQVTTPEGLTARYYMVRDGRTSLVTFPEETSEIWDMMSHRGRTYALISSGPWSTVELVCDDERKSIGMPPEASMVSCRMFVAGDDVCIEGLYNHDDGKLASGIWVKGEEYMLFETGQAVTAVCSSGEDICCVLNPDAANPSGMIFKSGKIFTMPEGYACTGNTPMALHDGNLYVGLTSTGGYRPVLWKNGITDTLRLNGPLCSVAFSSHDAQ